MIETYNKALQAIYDHVGFVEDWAVYPIEDRNKMFWSIGINNDTVKFAETKDKFNSGGDYSGGDYYVYEIYKQRFYNKWIYRGDNYTMIIVDTHTDGNKFFAVFDNNMEIK